MPLTIFFDQCCSFDRDTNAEGGGDAAFVNGLLLYNKPSALVIRLVQNNCAF